METSEEPPSRERKWTWPVCDPACVFIEATVLEHTTAARFIGGVWCYRWICRIFGSSRTKSSGRESWETSGIWVKSHYMRFISLQLTLLLCCTFIPLLNVVKCVCLDIVEMKTTSVLFCYLPAVFPLVSLHFWNGFPKPQVKCTFDMDVLLSQFTTP